LIRQATEKLKRTQKDNEISLGTLMQFSNVGYDRFEDITKRILAGFGLDWTNENAKLSFDTYCRIQSFLEYQTMSDAELVKMWVKILNPSSLPVIEVSEMQDFFERFTRGKSLKEPSLISDTFAK
jgi:hypothetical protein